MASSDPGGGNPPNITNLQETFNQQQAKISALKELVRKSEASQGKNTASAQEKVRNIAQRLTHLKSKASRSRLNVLDRSKSDIKEEEPEVETSSVTIQQEHTLEEEYVYSSHDTTPISSYQIDSASSTPVLSRARSETPGSEKIHLLRMQMEQNRQKMVERENNKRGIEEMVTQLKAKMDTTQLSLEKSSELGKSIGDLSIISFSGGSSDTKEKFHKSVQDLSVFTGARSSGISDREKVINLENKIRELEAEARAGANKENVPQDAERIEHVKIVKELENRILDLEENLREKECVIEARTQAVSLMSKDLSLKGKNTVEMLEETRQEMFKMQQNFVEAEKNLRDEIIHQQTEIHEKDHINANLEEMNNILETARFDLTLKNAELQSKIDEVLEYSSKLNELKKINQSLQHRITDLESQKYEFITDEEVELAKRATLVEPEDGSDVNLIKELNEKIIKLEKENEQLKQKVAASNEENEEYSNDDLQSLKNKLEDQKELIEGQKNSLNEIEEQLTEKSIEYNVLNASFSVLQEKLKQSAPKSLFSQTTDERAEIELTKLKSQLDDANKSMIKSKLKMKQMQKQIDSFKKISNVNQEVVKLTADIHSLQQRNAELEDEKGNLQLSLVNIESGKMVSSEILSETELENKVKVLEATCQNQTSAIQLLEEQKIDMISDLQTTQSELATLKSQIHEFDTQETSRVTSQMDSIAMEEKLERLTTERNELAKDVQELKNINEVLKRDMERLEAENNELITKVDKLNSERVSSAESIEIVEKLTKQEKFEIAKYEYEHHTTELLTSADGDGMDEVDETLQPEMKIEDAKIGEELNDSLVKLREESSELMEKIELFTNERREVLEKMELMSIENNQLTEQLKELQNERDEVQAKYDTICMAATELEGKLEDMKNERNELLESTKEMNANRMILQEEINVLIRQQNAAHEPVMQQVVGMSDDKDASPVNVLQFDREYFERGINVLNSELENHKKTKDKGAKQRIAKKILQDAKNLQTLMIELLDRHTVSIQEYENLKATLDNSKLTDKPSSIVDSVLIKEMEAEILKLKTMLTDASTAQIDKQTIEEELQECRVQITEAKSKEKELYQEINRLKDICKKMKDADDQAAASLQESNDKHVEFVKILNSDIEDRDFELSRRLAELSHIKGEYEGRLSTSKQEIQILKALVAEQKEQLIQTLQDHEDDINDKTLRITELEAKVALLSKEVTTIQKNAVTSAEKYGSDMSHEIETLKQLLEENNRLLDEHKREILNKQETIETLNGQMMEVYRNAEESSKLLADKDDEIAYLQELLDSNRSETRSLDEQCSQNMRQISQLQNDLENRRLEIEHLHSNDALNTSDDEKIGMQRRIVELEKMVKDLEERNKEQLEKMKKLVANLKKKVLQCTELEKRVSSVDDTQNEKLKALEGDVRKLNKDKSTLEQDLKCKLAELEHIEVENKALQMQLLQEKQTNDNNVRLNELLQEKLTIIDKLQQNLSTLQDEINIQNHEKNKILINLQQSSETQKNIVDDLEKELLSSRSNLNNCVEELKQAHEKINKLTQINEQFTSEINTKDIHNEQLKVQFNYEKAANDEKILQFSNKVQEMENLLVEKGKELQMKSDKFDKCRIIVKERTKEIHRLQENLAKVEDKSNSINSLQELNTELSNKCAELKLQVDDFEIWRQNYGNDAAKLQEKQLYIESLESDNQNLQNRISKLQEVVADMEERRSSLETQTSLLGVKLEEQTVEFTQHEDELVQRLATLSEHDGLMERKLREEAQQRNELQERYKDACYERDELHRKITHLESHIETIELEKVVKLEKENASLSEQIAAHQADARRLHSDFERRMAEKTAEIDEMESDLSTQLQRVDQERRLLQESLEKSRDQNVDLQDELVRLKDIFSSVEQARAEAERELVWLRMQNESLTQDHLEVQELRMQIVQDQTEIENWKTQHSQVMQEHELEIIALRTQITELDSLRTQVAKNKTDDQAQLENEMHKLLEKLKIRDDEIQQLKGSILQVEPILGVDVMQVKYATKLEQSINQHFHSEQQNRPQREEMFLPASSLFGTPPASDPFAAFIQSNIQQAGVVNNNIIQSAQQSEPAVELKDSDEVIAMRKKLTELEMDVQHGNEEINLLNQECIIQKTQLNTLIQEKKQLENDFRIASIKVEQLESLQHEKDTLNSSVNDALECEQKQRTIEFESSIKNLEIQLQDALNKYDNCKWQLDERSRELVEMEMTTSSRHAHILELEEKVKQLQDQLNKSKQIQMVPNIPLLPKAPPPTPAEGFGIPAFDSNSFFASGGGSFFDQPINEQQTSMSNYTDIIDGNVCPVVEDIIVPKKAYVCHPSQETQTEALSEDMFASIEDQIVSKKSSMQDTVNISSYDEGWGWGSNEAALEEQHQMRTLSTKHNLLTPSVEKDIKIQEQQDYIHELEKKYEKMVKNVESMQTKYKQMLQKMKDMKARNEELIILARTQKKSPSVEANDLDLAIQEELSSQVKQLELKLQELTVEREKEHHERDSLLKRIDVLTAGNDRMAEMKDRQDTQLEMYQVKMKQLTAQLEQLSDWGESEEPKVKVTELQQKQEQIYTQQQPCRLCEENKKRIKELKAEVKDVHVDNEELQALLEEERAQVARCELRLKSQQDITNKEEDLKQAMDEINVRNDKISILEKQYDEAIASVYSLSEDSANIKQSLERLSDEHRQKIDENNNLSKELSQLGDKNAELSNEIERMKTASLFHGAGEVPTISSATGSQITEVLKMEEQIQELNAKLQYKDSEILHLNQQIKDAISEDQTPSLVQEILTKAHEIQSLRQKVQQFEQERIEMENNLALQLTQQMRGEEVSLLRKELAVKSDKIEKLEQERNDTNQELQVLNEQVLSSLLLEDRMKTIVLELDMKNIEIEELKSSLNTMRENQDLGQIVQPNDNTNKEAEEIKFLKNQIAQLEHQWSFAVEQRGNDVAESWKQHLSAREEEFTKQINELKGNANNTNTPVLDTTLSATECEEESDIVAKMQLALEAQEMEIVTLKEQLAIRSAEYARLASQTDPFGRLTSSNMTSVASRLQRHTDIQHSEPRHELDLALYMLHQRDMRCEELTEELIALLQERDTLQLRLSNSIRQIEDIKKRTGFSGDPGSDGDSSEANLSSKPNSPSKLYSNINAEQLSAATEAEAAIEAIETTSLDAKLSQLQAVSHARDKHLREEREQRHRQMEMLQKDVANMPAEAVAHLVGADYTLSRTTQSTSNTILNWLLGKNTPREPQT